MKDHRPINLDLRTLKFPMTAIASILHRLSGVFLFLMIPLVLLSLQYSLQSQGDFLYVKSLYSLAIPKIILWLLLSSLAYHALAGIRHLLMDVGLGEHLRTATVSAYLVTVLGVVLFILIGVWLWV